MSRTTLRARWLLPISRPAIDGGFVTFADGRIVDVGAGRPADGGQVVDLGDAALLPGFVNPHTHLEFSDLQSPLGAAGQPLPEWIRRVISQRKRGDREACAAISAGLAENLRHGVTTIGEIATASAGCYGSASPRPTAVLFQEALGFSGARIDSALADVEQRLAAALDAGLPAGVSPHAPYSTHPRLVEGLVATAAQRGLPIAMHLAESQDEVDFLASGSGPFRELLEERSMWDPATIAPGSRPLDYLRILVASGSSRTLVIHGNYLAAEEIAFVAERRATMSIVYCPRTHAWFGHEPYPLDTMLRSRVRLALGTDSRASNPDLDLLAEARFAALRFPGVEPAQWLAMITVEAAAALGLEASCGALERGKRADFVALPLHAGETDSASAIVGGEATPLSVWFRGQRVA